jgi:hypothetical protein
LEEGYLIGLYGASVKAMKRAETVPGALASGEKFLDQRFDRPLLRFLPEANAILVDYCYLFEGSLAEIVFFSQILVERYWPAASIEVEDYVNKAAALGNIKSLNKNIKRMDLLRAKGMGSMIDVWLSTFDRPDTSAGLSISSDILNGQYWVEDRVEDHLEEDPLYGSFRTPVYRLPEVVGACSRAVELLEVCMIIVRRMVFESSALRRTAVVRAVAADFR